MMELYRLDKIKMRRIKLKEKSPEYLEEGKALPKEQLCEHPYCQESGEYKAPKNRDLSEHYHFCFEHVREYNLKWNFFDGMSEKEIEDYIYKSNIWDRKTWNFASQSEMESYLRQKIHEDYAADEGPSPGSQREHRDHVFRESGTPEAEALAILDLNPPITLKDIKARYKTLVKKYHPDAHGGNKEFEERLKKINMAYTVLKVAYENYEILTKDE